MKYENNADIHLLREEIDSFMFLEYDKSTENDMKTIMKTEFQKNFILDFINNSPKIRIISGIGYYNEKNVSGDIQIEYKYDSESTPIQLLIFIDGNITEPKITFKTITGKNINIKEYDNLPKEYLNVFNKKLFSCLELP